VKSRRYASEQAVKNGDVMGEDLDRETGDAEGEEEDAASCRSYP
jgi:hypothetical protein